MSYNKTNIKEGVKLHIINTKKFKTNIISIFLTTKLDRKNVTQNALIPAVLRMGTNNIKTQELLNKKLEEMYGANFNCGIEKRGDNHVLKFYIETINDEFCLDKEKIFEQSVNLLMDIVFNPLNTQNSFDEEYVNCEKENLKRIINSKIDNKAGYAYTRCIEEMYKNKEYGLYECGYVEDLANINNTNLYQYYNDLIDMCKIDIFVSGNFEEGQVEAIINKNSMISNLKPRNPEYINNSKEKVDTIEEKEVKESMNITQGKLVIGLSTQKDINESILNVYNAILGGGANSKLFQNVREKAGLAYTAGSGYLKAKNNIIIRCGIEIKNYEKAVNIIKDQLKDMKLGNFSDIDIENAKRLIRATLNSVKDEQGSEISYNMSQELTGKEPDIENYISIVEKVNKEEIRDAAKNLVINTIYFLKD